MGFFDKVKEQAGKAVGQAHDLTDKVGAKVGEVQSKRKADDLLDDLGRFLYAEKTGRPIAGADAEIARIVLQLQALEADGVAVLEGETATAPESGGGTESPGDTSATADSASAE
ncbi:MAG: hypothetical protein ACRDZ8_07770 [Acidimicrobiales bacterium]